MEINITIEKKHLVFLSIFLILILSALTLAVKVSDNVGYHPLTEIVNNLVDKEIVDQDSNGIIDSADNAFLLSNTPLSALQLTISDNCPSGESIRQINQDGSIVCEKNNMGTGGSSTPGTYVGFTSTAYNGNIGGYAAANIICNNEFSGTRMCSSADFINGIPPDTGWFSTFTATPHVAGQLYDVSDCGGWYKDKAYRSGVIWTNLGKAAITNCESQNPILCCSI